MAGIKRRVEVADDRGGKRTKVKKDTLKQQQEGKKAVKGKKEKKVESSSSSEDEEVEEMQLDEEEQSAFLSEDEDNEGGMDIDGAEEEAKSNGATVKNGMSFSGLLWTDKRWDANTGDFRQCRYQ